MGFNVNETALTIIQDCDDWYANRVTKFHKRKNINNAEIELHRLNLAKRCCADDANLSVLGERRDKETVVSEKKEVETINTPNVAKKVVIIEDEEVPLAKSLGDFEHSENWWILIIIALVCITGFLVYHNKKSSLC